MLFVLIKNYIIKFRENDKKYILKKKIKSLEYLVRKGKIDEIKYRDIFIIFVEYQNQYQMKLKANDKKIVDMNNDNLPTLIKNTKLSIKNEEYFLDLAMVIERNEFMKIISFDDKNVDFKDLNIYENKNNKTNDYNNYKVIYRKSAFKELLKNYESCWKH